MKRTGAELSDEEMRAQVLHYENEVDQLVATGTMREEDAWDAYFGLLHECDLRGFLEERRRILTKIDTTHYNPFTSKNPEVRIIIRLRIARFKIPSVHDN